MSKQTNEDIMVKGGSGSRNKTMVILIICAIVIIALLGTVIFLLLNKKEEPETPQEVINRETVVNEENVNDIVNAADEADHTEPGYYEVTMNSTWYFEDGKATSDNAYVENSTSNNNSVYFDVVRSDTNEVVYASPIMPVGSSLDSIKLDQELSKGTYDCVCTYHLLNDANEAISSLDLKLTLVVNN